MDYITHDLLAGEIGRGVLTEEHLEQRPVVGELDPRKVTDLARYEVLCMVTIEATVTCAEHRRPVSVGAQNTAHDHLLPCIRRLDRDHLFGQPRVRQVLKRDHGGGDDKEARCPQTATAHVASASVMPRPSVPSA